MVAPAREIRARFTDGTIRVYQAYSSAIADPAIAAQKFVPPFKLTRMTWIKPSFFWMMYRSGWGTKEGQDRVLAIDITRSGFEWALQHSCLSHFTPEVHASLDSWRELKQNSPVRIQWDPERDHQLERLDYRSIQIGLAAEAAERYMGEWVRSISDVTDMVRNLRVGNFSLKRLAFTEIRSLELAYPLSRNLAARIGASCSESSQDHCTSETSSPC